MQEIDPIEAMSRSEYLSANTLADDLRAALETLLPQAVNVGERLAGDIDRILLVGSGGSYAALLTAQYALESQIGIPVAAIPAKEIPWRAPIYVNERTAVIYASYSGETADVIEAMKYLAPKRVRTLAITAKPKSTLATSCDDVFVYEGTAIYEIPLVLVLAFAVHVASASPAILDSVRSQVSTLDLALENAPERMRELASRLSNAEHLYVLGSGPQTSLAFKLSGVLMENVRIGATYVDASEMRHGPIEAIADRQPVVLGLLGVDESRSMTAGVLRFMAERGCQVEVLDAQDATIAHPHLAPLVLNPLTQWLVGWMAWDRGIIDLDERIFMGKGLLSPGAWP